ncbi:type VI secretion system baseplate subunit TssE [Pseudomonas zhanjiangensis]|uniref:Type VI secretion system baseplate subunit TssE n=1 Tax=Pseudomonas zhanjiangensis TaxID=3239015 RepID=A0ABV3YMT6_9PSED
MAAFRHRSQAPLLDRLASYDEARPAQVPAFDRQALADSVRQELLRLLNTRRSLRPRLKQLTVIDYGIADWSGLYADRSDDRLRLAREIRLAIAHFEPRLQLGEVDVQALDGSRHALRVRINGYLRSGVEEWPVAYAMDLADGVVHERFD